MGIGPTTVGCRSPCGLLQLVARALLAGLWVVRLPGGKGRGSPLEDRGRGSRHRRPSLLRRRCQCLHLHGSPSLPEDFLVIFWDYDAMLRVPMDHRYFTDPVVPVSDTCVSDTSILRYSLYYHCVVFQNRVSYRCIAVPASPYHIAISVIHRRVLHAPVPEDAVRLTFRCWWRESWASLASMDYRLTVRIVGVPAHLRSTAQEILGSSCNLIALAPETELKASVRPRHSGEPPPGPDLLPLEKVIVAPIPVHWHDDQPCLRSLVEN